MPRVLNKRTDTIPIDAIYVGRPTKWGNPFIIGRDGTRTEVIERYAHMICTSDLVTSFEELRGKDLVCWCAPLPCHADVLLKLANRTHTLSCGCMSDGSFTCEQHRGDGAFEPRDDPPPT